MTYQELIVELNKLTQKQLNCDVTVELKYGKECFPAILRIAGEEHFCLDENHPIIFVKEY